jgi:hypothetical protein
MFLQFMLNIYFEFCNPDVRTIIAEPDLRMGIPRARISFQKSRPPIAVSWITLSPPCSINL